MTAGDKKVVVISLDGATFSVLGPLMQQGYLPSLEAIMSRSLSADLESVAPPVTAPAWTSFMTGKHPNKHGIFDFSSFDHQSRDWKINNARNIRSKTIWEILSENNKRVVVLNLPYTYPPSKVEGVMVSGWDAPFTGQSFSYPPEVGSEILRAFPDYKQNLWISELQPLHSKDQFVELLHKLQTGFEQQTKIALDMLARQSWDVFMVHFQQTDWIQHKLWSLIERACDHPQDHAPEIEAVRNCYRHFDRLVGQLDRGLQPFRPTTIVLSDHGFGRLMGNIHPSYYLKKWGYLSVRPEKYDRLRSIKVSLRQSKLKPVSGIYKLLVKARNNLNRNQKGSGHKSWTDNAADVMGTRGATWDWDKTKVALIYAYQMGFLYVNLAGRTPAGVVQPGDEYETLLADLTLRFRQLRHPQTSQKLFQDVVRGVDLYPPAENGVLVPDLVLVPVDGFGFSFSLNDAAPEISDEGTHRHNGILMINGSEIKSSSSDFRPNLIDIAPTILHILGIPVPTDMDGRVLEEILTSQSPVLYDEVSNDSSRKEEYCDQAESDILAQRLKGLGYLD